MPTRHMSPGLGLLLAAALAAAVPCAHAAPPPQVKTVFVIAFENHNWTQPNGNVDIHSDTIEQLKGNPAAPFLNSLVDGTSPLSAQVAYTNTYHNLLATPSGRNPSIHPSELSYIWSEAGTRFGVKNDHDPYQTETVAGVNTFVGTNQDTTEHLSNYLSRVGISWRSYQEDIDLLSTDPTAPVNHPPHNTLTDRLAPRERWTVPIASFSGHSADYTNPYNHSHQYSYGAKHNPMVFFTDTNGGNTTDPTPQAAHYAPLQQLADDLAANRVARYNWITPDQYNEMHSPLRTDFEYRGTTYRHGTDAQQIAAADHCLSVLVGQITASQAYRDGGAIILWMDETEPQNHDDKRANDFAHTLPCIVISPLAHANIGGKPYAADAANYSHSSFLRTMQEIFDVGPFLGAAADTPDLSALFAPGAIRQGGLRDVSALAARHAP